ncbi:MAG TPA: inositol monophosphatase family protein [Candidatus Saccharicenans sp.]|jgi:myo-inositol-1(or 4)-monophosphatase|nr:inositol monophosphatase [Candidatus Saccharicenans sp.]HRD01887.1 inositol monophosphatase family protein [Candidatus Saccharicenans sp.]
MENKGDCACYLKAAVKAARQAGDFLLAGLHQAKKVDFKGEIDLVTAFDRKSEEMIFNELSSLFPDHNFLAEENIRRDNHSDFSWIVDPLDGTTNFAHGLPIFCVSIALTCREEVIAGVVYDPNRREMFTAIKGEGAYLNDRPVRVSLTTELDKSLLATGFPYDVRTSPDNNLNYFSHFALSAQAIRRCGSAALDLCYTAGGRFDGFWEIKLKPWDLAAGSLFVREAGGKTTDLFGREFNLNSPDIVASNGLIHQAMLEIIRISQIKL